MQQPAVVVREREVEEHHVARQRQPLVHLVALLHHRVVVAVADHAGLRRPGRSRRVDEREQIVLVDRVGALLQRARMRGGVGTAARTQLVEPRERDDVLQPRRRPWPAAPRPRRARRRTASARARTARRARSCSRRSARRRLRPGRARSRTAPTRGSCGRAGRTSRPSAIPSASRPFAISSTASAASAHETSLPLAVDLVEVRRARARLAPSRCARDSRSSSSRPLASNLAAGSSPRARIHARPSTLYPADAHNLERISQLRPRQHPRRARAGDEAGRAPVGCLVPDAPPRVRHADQAEALLPGPRARRRVRRARQAAGRSRRASS